MGEAKETNKPEVGEDEIQVIEVYEEERKHKEVVGDVTARIVEAPARILADDRCHHVVAHGSEDVVQLFSASSSSDGSSSQSSSAAPYTRRAREAADEPRNAPHGNS